ncbi:chorion class CB protein M5H4-like [Pectinophora gossypiella]|uniref:chorion class CB protein M5H4-like n=1 Tax=Pectinophora gossypiella TaxID=13191 RepID=UPI00214DF1E2|nr:chorion class CB protein M5H4-like [Pectinophora gossypiella]
MSFKKVVFCASVLVIQHFQTITAQCINNQASANGLIANNIGLGYGANQNLGYSANQNLGYAANQATSNGGAFVVTSQSPIAPTGLSVLAENLAIEGVLAVDGQLPLLGTVAVEGAIPTGGQAGTSYSCGNGNVGITNEIGGSVLGNNLGAGSPNIGANVGPKIGSGIDELSPGQFVLPQFVERFSLPAMVRAMIDSEQAWRAVATFADIVMSAKEVVEREREDSVDSLPIRRRRPGRRRQAHLVAIDRAPP